MTKSTARSKASVDAQAAAPFDLLHGQAAQGYDAWIRMNQNLIEGVVRLQQEAGRFVARRLEQDLARQRDFLACRTPEDVWQAYAGFAQQAVADYAAEAEQLSKIAAEVQTTCAGFGEIVAGQMARPVDPATTKAD